MLTTSLVMDFESDLLGRTKKVVYPDGISIHYVYRNCSPRPVST